MTIERNHSERKCSRCGITKPLDDFGWYYYETQRKRANYCKVCAARKVGRRTCMICKHVGSADEYPFLPNGERDRFCPKCRESHPYAKIAKIARSKIDPIPVSGYKVVREAADDDRLFVAWGEGITVRAVGGLLDTPGFPFERGAILSHPTGWELQRASRGWFVARRPAGADATDWG